jgi:hypothetical protein
MYIDIQGIVILVVPVDMWKTIKQTQIILVYRQNHRIPPIYGDTNFRFSKELHCG